MFDFVLSTGSTNFSLGSIKYFILIINSTWQHWRASHKWNGGWHAVSWVSCTNITLSGQRWMRLFSPACDLNGYSWYCVHNIQQGTSPSFSFCHFWELKHHPSSGLDCEPAVHYSPDSVFPPSLGQRRSHARTLIGLVNSARVKEGWGVTLTAHFCCCY